MHYSKTKNLVHPQVVVLNLLLVLSLLFTQWLGISHAIFHASQSSVVSIANVEPVVGDTFDHQKSSSFCSLFDAAAGDLSACQCREGRFEQLAYHACGHLHTLGAAGLWQ
jgi:hypothetical protein